MIKSKESMLPANRWYMEKDYQLPEKMVQEFYDRVVKLAEETFGRDGLQSDLPIDIEIVDRTRFERLHFQPIPYDHKIKDDDVEKQERLLDALQLNVKIAIDRLSTHLNTLYHRRHRKLLHSSEREKKT